jgi:4-hydroxybenzoate polyprenyltransferase
MSLADPPRLLFRWLVESSLWASCGIASLALLCADALGATIHWQLLALAVGVPLLVLNVDHILDQRLEAGRQQRAGAARSGLFWAAALLALALVAVGWSGTGRGPRGVCLISLALGLAYGVPAARPRGNETGTLVRLKSVPGLKAWFVTLLITFFCVTTVVLDAGVAPSTDLILLVVFLLVFVGSNAHMFDIRDLDEDRISGTPTLPILVGVARTKMILLAMNLVLLLLVLATSLAGSAGLAVRPAYIVGILVSLACIIALDAKSSRILYALFVDGGLFVPAAIFRLLG